MQTLGAAAGAAIVPDLQPEADALVSAVRNGPPSAAARAAAAFAEAAADASEFAEASGADAAPLGIAGAAATAAAARAVVRAHGEAHRAEISAALAAGSAFPPEASLWRLVRGLSLAFAPKQRPIHSVCRPLRKILGIDARLLSHVQELFWRLSRAPQLHMHLFGALRDDLRAGCADASSSSGAGGGGAAGGTRSSGPVVTERDTVEAAAAAIAVSLSAVGREVRPHSPTPIHGPPVGTCSPRFPRHCLSRHVPWPAPRFPRFPAPGCRAVLRGRSLGRGLLAPQPPRRATSLHRRPPACWRSSWPRRLCGTRARLSSRAGECGAVFC